MGYSRSLVGLAITLTVPLLLPTSNVAAVDVASSFRFPLDIPWSITQHFDRWNDDFIGFHLAEDVKVPIPTGGEKKDTEVPVRAAGSGKVKHVGYHTGYGWVILIEHTLSAGDPLGPTVTTLYAHLREVGLTANTMDVSKGAVIGYLSSNKDENGGYSFTHIHFGIRRGAVLSDINQCHPITKWWSYAGYSSLFTKCHTKSTLVNVSPSSPNWGDYESFQRTVVSEWTDPSDFVHARSVPVPPPNQVPTAGFTMTAPGLPPKTNGETLTVTVPFGGAALVDVAASDCSPGPASGCSADPDGQIASRAWTLDGARVNVLPTDTLPLELMPGSHTVTLVVTDNQGAPSPPVQGEILVQADSIEVAPGLRVDFRLVNAQQVVGPTGEIAIEAVVSNDSSSTQTLLGSSLNGSGYTFGSLIHHPTFAPGNPYVWSVEPLPLAQLANAIVPPGGSFRFSFGTLMPRNGPVPEGVYTAALRLGYGFCCQFDRTVTVTVDAALGAVPVFDFALDFLHVDGNVNSSAGFADEFDDGSLTALPTSAFSCRAAPVSESGGLLHLSSSNGTAVGGQFSQDHCFLGDPPGSLYRLRDGAGDAVITASFRADVPVAGTGYGFQVFTTDNSGELVNMQIGRSGDFAVLSATVESPGGSRVNQSMPLDLSGINRILLRLIFDDATNCVTSSFSTNGGSSFTEIVPPLPGTIMTGGSEAIVSVFGFAVIAVISPTSNVNWTQKFPVGAPSARAQHVLAFDTSRGEVVLFGGVVNGPTGAEFANDTWVWNGANWTERIAAESPAPRSSYGMTYEPVPKQTVLFGGVGNGVWFDDTWIWNGSTWTLTNPTTRPSARSGHTLAYDAVRNEVILFGGQRLPTLELLNDTWIWNGSTWTQRFPVTPPPSRYHYAMGYDSTHGRVVLFGGVGTTSQLNDTWIWDGTNWHQMVVGSSPTARYSAHMGDSPLDGGVILFGGADGANNPIGDTWTWDGSGWSLRSPAASPQSRLSGAITFDSWRFQVVLFGGTSNAFTFVPLSDTWIWGP